MMKNFLKIVLAVMIVSVNCFAQSDSKDEKEFYVGANIPRLFANDYEVQVSYRLSKKIILGLSGGYDFNAGEKYFVDAEPVADTTNWKPQLGGLSYEGENNETSRYFYGKGLALRAFVENLYVNKRRKHEQRFCSVEVIFKVRNYDNYWYQQNIRFLESANQNIYGLSVFWGRNVLLGNHFSLKIFNGFGIRYLSSNITRPGYLKYNDWVPENKFTYARPFPVIQLGLVLVFNTAGTGVPFVK